MKNKLLFSLIIISVFVSCKKDYLSHGEPIGVWGVDDSDIYSYISQTDQHVLSPLDSQLYNIQVFSGFEDSITGGNVAMQSIVVNSHLLTGQPGGYEYQYTDSPHDPNGRNLPGTYSTVKIAGISVADTVSTSFYQPEDIGTSLQGAPGWGGLNISQPCVLTWKPDPHASALKVNIMIMYNGSSTQDNNNNKLFYTFKTLDYWTQDNGSFTIPVADLDTIPVSSILTMEVYRSSETQVILPVSHKRLVLAGVSDATIMPFTVFQQ